VRLVKEVEVEVEERVVMSDREVLRVVRAQPTSDGAGVKLNRSLGTGALPMLDPFLMLDEFYTDRPEDYLAGFPSHPHRGFETVTYMLAGAMEHKDSVGNTGKLIAGSVQWMTAGRGIVHSEMPKQENGLMWGFQLWVNLPGAKKMIPPRYQDIAPEKIPEVTIGDARVRVIAGEAGGVRGPVEGVATAPLMIDVKLPAGAKIEQAIAADHNAFVYVFEGEARFGSAGKSVGRGELGVLGPGDAVSVVGAGEKGARFLILAGRPINERVARYGPFVMTTEDEIRQAMVDYQSGKLGT
jgi:redox-sensitive bicupin YhaK (pirin superfamily)